MNKIVKMYLHREKESNYEKGKRIGLKGKALENFMYALYEVKLDVEVNMETGDARIIKVNGYILSDKINNNA